MSESSDQSLASHLEGFRQFDAQRQSFVETVLERYKLLERRYEEKCNDFDNEVDSRRRFQNQCAGLQREQADLFQRCDSNAFVLAMIDGDGAIFQDALLKAGQDGGADAAHRLSTEIKQYIQTNSAASGGWSVIVQIYTNLEGLGKKLAFLGIISSPGEIHTFSRAFNLNQPLFSIIDVGSGKERADHKLKEYFRLFIANVQCKHIFFGGTHDNGYLPVLDTYKRDPDIAKRITLLGCTTIQPAFRELGFPVVQFDSVFRNTNLPERPSGLFSGTPVSRQAPTMAPPTVPTNRNETPPSPRSDSPLHHPPSASSGNTWATIGRNGVTEKKIKISSSQFVPRKYILLNAFDQRLDAPLPKADKAAIERINEQTKQNKFCNEYHLSGQCNDTTCPYRHGERLSAADQLALRGKVRQRCCSHGDGCWNFDCLWGHQCPWINSPQGCMYGANCNFIRVHDKDTRPAMKRFEDSSVEILH